MRQLNFKQNSGYAMQSTARAKFEKYSALLDDATVMVAVDEYGRFHPVAILRELRNARPLVDAGFHVVN